MTENGFYLIYVLARRVVDRKDGLDSDLTAPRSVPATQRRAGHSTRRLLELIPVSSNMGRTPASGSSAGRVNQDLRDV
jgi:hypothetical protein